MNIAPLSPEGLSDLIDAVLEGNASPEELAQLESRLLADEAACRYYLEYVAVHSAMMLLANGTVPTSAQASDSADTDAIYVGASSDDGDVALESPQLQSDSELLQQLPNVLVSLDDAGTATAPRRWLSSFAPGGVLFSYAVSGAVMLVGLIVGWMYHISSHVDSGHHDSVVANALSNHQPQVQPVAQITDLFDCRWADPSVSFAKGASLYVGQRFALTSGLLEIRYTSGAVVLLQGPVSYQLDSLDGGYLARGRLTAKVEKQIVGGAAAPSDSLTSSNGVPLFAVRTPTSIVTDLGTEFGVEVDESGSSETHVFQGRIEIRSLQAKGGTAAPVLLLASQSARVDARRPDNVIIEQKPDLASHFARRLPKRSPLAIHSTGLGVRVGDNDLHWEVSARSDDPTFAPRPAVIAELPVHHYAEDPRGVGRVHMLPNVPNESQWLSLSKAGNYPDGVTYTFRTAFDLTDHVPATAALHGRFIADDHISAIRINGKPVQVPRHEWSWLFFSWSDFQVASGFVPGKNTLEFDVYNGAESKNAPGSQSGVYLRVELQGVAVHDWRSQATEGSSPVSAAKD